MKKNMGCLWIKQCNTRINLLSQAWHLPPWHLPWHHFTAKGGKPTENFEKNSKYFRFWLGGAAPQTPQFLAGRGKPPQTCNGKHIQFISIQCNLMLHVISEASVMTCSSSVSWPQHVTNMFIFKGFSHCLFGGYSQALLSSHYHWFRCSFQYPTNTC